MAVEIDRGVARVPDHAGGGRCAGVKARIPLLDSCPVLERPGVGCRGGPPGRGKVVESPGAVAGV